MNQFQESMINVTRNILKKKKKGRNNNKKSTYKFYKSESIQ